VGSDAALSVTAVGHHRLRVLILGFAFHWQSTRAREGDLIKRRPCAAASTPRSIADDADCGTGPVTRRIFWSQSMFTMLGLESRSDLLTFGEVNALVKSDDIDLFANCDQLISTKINHIDQTFRISIPMATGSGCGCAASSPPRPATAGCI